MLIHRIVGKQTLLSALRAKFSGCSGEINFERYSRHHPDGSYLSEFHGKDVTINVLDIRPLPGYDTARICTYEVLADGVPYAKRCCESVWPYTNWNLSARHMLDSLDDLPGYRFTSITVNITGESVISNMVNPASITR